VRIVDRGTCAVSNEGGDVIRLDLQGEILQGGFTLTRMEETSWQLDQRR
jgi:hypothetical protein